MPLYHSASWCAQFQNNETNLRDIAAIVIVSSCLVSLFMRGVIFFSSSSLALIEIPRNMNSFE
jgi:hypothetical protein